MKIAKFLFLLLLSFFLYWIYAFYSEPLAEIVYVKIILFGFIFTIINYAFISLILALIDFYYNLIIIYKDQVVLIKCSLLFRDDIELIDAYRIMKVDTYSRGILANVLGFGNLIIEQQRDDVRVFHFIPKPYQILLIIKRQRECILSERKKKYVVPDAEEEVGDLADLNKLDPSIKQDQK